MQIYSCLSSCHPGLQCQVCGLKADAARYPTAAANPAQGHFTAACSLTSDITGIVHVAVPTRQRCFSLYHSVACFTVQLVNQGPHQYDHPGLNTVVHISLDVAHAYCAKPSLVNSSEPSFTSCTCKLEVTLCYTPCLSEVGIPL